MSPEQALSIVAQATEPKFLLQPPTRRDYALIEQAIGVLSEFIRKHSQEEKPKETEGS